MIVNDSRGEKDRYEMRNVKIWKTYLFFPLVISKKAMVQNDHDFLIPDCISVLGIEWDDLLTLNLSP